MRGRALRAGAALAVVVVLAVGALVLRRAAGRKLHRFPYLTGPASSQGPELARFTVSSVEVAPGVALRVATRRGTGAGWLVFFAGNDERPLDQGARWLERTEPPGRSLLTFAPRGFDGSGGEPSPSVAVADALVVLSAHGVTPADTTLVGFSLGAPTAAHVAAEWTKRGTPPARVVTIAGAAELAMLPRAPWAALLEGDVYEVEPSLRVGAPVLALHGADDHTLPPSMLEAWRARIEPAGTLTTRVLPGEDHATVLDATTSIP